MDFRHSRARWTLRIGILLASLLFVLLAAEALVRLTIYWGSVTRAEASKNNKSADPDLPVLKGMFELGRKDVRGMHKGVFFRTNSQRIRGPEYLRYPEDGVFRIAITGDSVTMGEGVEESSAYSALLGEILGEKMPDRRFEVINVGLSGANTRLAMDRLEKVVDFYHPDLIVYGFTINDIEGPNYEARSEKVKNLQEVQSNPWFADSPLLSVRFVWWLLAISEPPWTGHRNWYAEEILFNYFENAEARNDWDRDFDRFHALAREKGICAHVFIHTHLNELEEDHPYLPVYQMVQEAAEERGLSVSPTFDYFAGTDPRLFRLSFLDAHPNVQAHAILAQALSEGLSGVPADCWQEGAYGQ